MARSYLAIFKKRRRAPFLEREKPLRREGRVFSCLGERRVAEGAGLDFPFFLPVSPSLTLTFLFLATSFFFLSASLSASLSPSSFAPGAARILVALSERSRERNTNGKRERRKQKESREGEKTAFNPSRSFSTSTLTTSKKTRNLFLLPQINHVGVLALPDVQGQDPAPAPARERRGGADVRISFCFEKKDDDD